MRGATISSAGPEGPAYMRVVGGATISSAGPEGPAYMRVVGGATISSAGPEGPAYTRVVGRVFRPGCLHRARSFSAAARSVSSFLAQQQRSTDGGACLQRTAE